MKTILIAIPTNKYIEPETMKAIYNLEVPPGYKTYFQYFYGYQIDQIRNLISQWAVHYDYLFSVDSDIAFKNDTLKKFLEHDVDMVSGLYIQRKENQHTLEVYESNIHGGNSNIPYEKIKNIPFLEIAACGMGCVLIKSKVLKDVGYPQFVYHSAIDHKNTISEDVDFCRKVKSKGFKIYADTTIQCSHIGAKTFIVDANPPTHIKKNNSGMIPTKAYILATKNPISVEYAKICAKSCDDIGLKWEVFEGYENMTAEQVWKNFDYTIHDKKMYDANAACTAGHFNIWKKIAKDKECAIILEHDAIMLHKINIEIPHNKIVALGYKLTDPNLYNKEKAGQPKEITDINNLYGSHAYAITYETAESLLKELKEKGVKHDLDNYYFSRENKNSGHSDIPLAITNPISTLAWIRKSTIWPESSPLNYRNTIDSFRQNLIQKDKQ
jgi:GR25 family glycosyltransferase involved in LPS biosynthesis